ncbi:exported hypothetical protein [Frankia canadensis]|uniref:Uncharacterized protein n=1 Tax=Frankia canadensis TaxID=1836972 RepID=A0A2I2KUH2_9ACTN|nr:exported hypothetical protein [Frankia canadensis]SOU56589.1 exported hypothetical protein [Frankia canadensis]
MTPSTPARPSAPIVPPTPAVSSLGVSSLAVSSPAARAPLSPPRRPAAEGDARGTNDREPAGAPPPTTIDRPKPGVSRPNAAESLPRPPAEEPALAIPSPAAEPTPAVALAAALGTVLAAGGARASLGPGTVGPDGAGRRASS